MVIIVLAVAVAMAQAPEKFTYQAVVRNASNTLVTNAQVGMRVSILQGSANGSAVYVETQTGTTNANGLVTLSIGGGNVQQGTFANIDWGNDPFYLKTETDPNGGSNYTVTTTQQLLSVPYALYSKEAGNSFSGDYNDLTNTPTIPTVPTNVSAFTNDAGYLTDYTEQQVLSISNDTLFLTGGSYVKLPAGFDGDYNSLTNKPTIPTVPTNVSAFTNDAGYITGTDIPEIPTVPTNVSAFTNDAGYLTEYTEQQVLSISNDTLFLTGGSFVKLPAGFDGDYNSLTNKPTIPTVPTNVSAFTNDAGYITGTDIPAIPTVPTNVSSFTNDAGYLTEYTEQQVLSISNDTLFLTGGSFVKLPAGFDGDYNSLTNKPVIPTVPTNVSAFTNDAGYIMGTDIPEIPTVPTNVSAFTNDAGYLISYTESQTLADVTSQGNSAGNRQLKDVSDPTESYDAVNLRTLVSHINSLQDTFQQQMQQMQQQMSQMQQKIDSLQNIVNSLDTNDNTPSGTVVIDEKSCPAAPTVTDHEGNVYATVQIGNQCWMRDNLRTTTSPSTGTYLIPAAGTDYTYTGKQALWYDNDSATYAPMNYGLLYNWNAAVDTFNTAYGETSVNTSTSNAVSVTFSGRRRGICPVGWHLPSNVEWMTMTNYVGGQSEFTCGGYSSYIAKALASAEGWYTDGGSCAVGNDSSVNNITGFSAVPAGGCQGSSFLGAGYGIFFWSSSQYELNPDSVAFACDLVYDYASVYREAFHKNSGLSVRCLRDDVSDVIDAKSCPADPTVTDHEGNVYATVQIGNQCWMRDNLRTTTSPSTGTYLIPAAGTGNTFTGKQAFWYNNDSATYAQMNYGLLYNWNAAVDTFNTAYGETSVNTDDLDAVSVTFTGHRRGICPVGWHLPSFAEWTTMSNFVVSQSAYNCGGNSGYIAKALASVEGWYTKGWYTDSVNCEVGNDPSVNNTTGFSAVPAGTHNDSLFWDAGHEANFWSATQVGSDAYGYRLLYNYAFWAGPHHSKSHGKSVRCLRDY